MFGKLFGKKQKMSPDFIYVTLNARLQPMHRGEIFEDPIDEKIQALSLGEVTGGGTFQNLTGEIENCDIEIQVKSSDSASIDTIKQMFENCGAPKGSQMVINSTGEVISFGVTEGLALYLNGTDLPQEVYTNSDVNQVISEISSLLSGKGSMFSHWEGSEETALYFYGDSFFEMSSLIENFLSSYPLCQKCRVQQIA